MSTVKLYDEDAYRTEFTAHVLSVREKEPGICDVVLDQTLFFPEEGGQSSDLGVLGGFRVLHVSIEDDTVIHTVECEDVQPEEGAEIDGRIDWHHRFSNMQNHTGEHILSGIMHDRWGIENKGFHLSDSIVTIDTSKELNEKELRELEHMANEAVYRNIPVDCRYVSAKELENMSYRSKIEASDSLRIVTIPGIDVCACCAPHVSHTGEIGIIKILKTIRYKGGMRLTVLSGERAFIYLDGVQRISDDLTHLLSEKPEKLTEAVERLFEENNSLKIKIKNEAAARLEKEIASMDDGREDVLIFTDPVDNVVQRNAVNMLSKKHGGFSAVFSSDENGGYNYILTDGERDPRETAETLKKELNARGGGSKDMVQGNVKASEADIRRVLEKA